MPLSIPDDLLSEYEKNRVKFSLAELSKYAGQWVAFSPDGVRILAGAETLAELDQRLLASGQDPQKVALERIEFEDSYLGGAELL